MRKAKLWTEASLNRLGQYKDHITMGIIARYVYQLTADYIRQAYEGETVIATQLPNLISSSRLGTRMGDYLENKQLVERVPCGRTRWFDEEGYKRIRPDLEEFLNGRTLPAIADNQSRRAAERKGKLEGYKLDLPDFEVLLKFQIERIKEERVGVTRY